MRIPAPEKCPKASQETSGASDSIEAMRKSWTIVDSDNIYCLAKGPNLLLVIWKDAPTQDRFDRVEDLTAELASEYPDGFGVLVVIEDLCGLPSDDIRSRNADLIDRYRYNLRGIGMVLEASGFRASALRCILSGIYLMTTRNVQQKVFSKVRNGLYWVRKELAAASPNLEKHHDETNDHLYEVIVELREEWHKRLENDPSGRAFSDPFEEKGVHAARVEHVGDDLSDPLLSEG